MPTADENPVGALADDALAERLDLMARGALVPPARALVDEAARRLRARHAAFEPLMVLVETAERRARELLALASQDEPGRSSNETVDAYQRLRAAIDAVEGTL